MIAAAARLLPVVTALLAFAAPGGSGGGARAAGPGWQETGVASWYGGRHHGRRTSSGEAFDQHAMTAAHPSLPLGSRIKVTVQDTGASVVVRITDRQPHKGVRIIDLSRGAASRIGLVSRGTGWVTLSQPGPGEEAEEVEVAEAPDAAELGATDAGEYLEGAPNPRRRGQQRMRRARPSAAAARPCCRAPSATPVRYSAPRRAARRTL